MDATARVLSAVEHALGDDPPGAISVAFSGGMDSSVLLEAVRRVALGRGLPLPRAIHVDHGLEREARAWSRHCQRWCASREIPFTRLRVAARPRRGESPEEAAREARYGAIAECLAAGEVLCVAHHAHDQAETVLMNLLRGSGAPGMGAMRGRRVLGAGILLRPLLDLERALLAACARAWGLVWVSDPANRRVQHPRNRLRHDVLPLLQSMNPAAVAAMCRSAVLSQEMADLAESIARDDLAACSSGRGDTIRRDALGALAPVRRRALLRSWLRRAGATVPGHAALAEMDRQILEAARDRNPSFDLGRLHLVVDRDRVFLLAPAAAFPPSAARRTWRPGETLELPGGRLWAEHGEGAGLRSAGTPLEVRFRVGGERCRPAGRGHSQTLKRLLQEYRLPVWMRSDLPLLYDGETIVAVAGLFVCHGYQAVANERGWQVRWQPRRVVEAGGCTARARPGRGPDDAV